MIRRIPVTDTTTGDQVVYEGETTDRLPDDKTLMVDVRTGNVYGPGQQLGALPECGSFLCLPQTTWYE